MLGPIWSQWPKMNVDLKRLVIMVLIGTATAGAAEASKYAAGAWKKKHVPERLLRWVGSHHDWRWE